MTSLHINRMPAAPAPHPLRRVTDWPLSEARRRRVCRTRPRPTEHPARRTSDRLRAAAPAPVTRACRPRGAARRRRARTVRAHAPRRAGSGAAGSDGPPAPAHNGHRPGRQAALVVVRRRVP
ncbi:Putative secreted protein [Streptomyces venezuelae]|uniref:hypothetical protein n=1 Tax=Streptomyces gardneri TaxID=66892 RepID=UPI0006BCA4DC|nr:hypothetical protein [Streptomyces gardneri]ALO06544.1 Putative secreted protein [Streptomyces venezuelae]QPK43969.1 hypothetical protein H4W23_04640 [Streptomyces gardneri]WRK35235.1 hypothetical protein U0M97_04665 [Streptomyces venezuelae]CUM43182.1 hypothetical protein BN2537_15329 [Streptomyces venezuelae]